ncbi:MAG: hypothetical protein ACLFQK_06530 [Fibrobacterota bacterium]
MAEKLIKFPSSAITSGEKLPFPVYIKSKDQSCRLYSAAGTVLTKKQVERVKEAGRPALFIPVENESRAKDYLESRMEFFLKSEDISSSDKAELLYM